MTEKLLRVGVIGAGRQGERHCRVMAGLAGVQFIGVSDVSAQRGRAVAVRHGVQFFRDYHQLLTEVDAVTIATPTPTHTEVIAASIARGIHLLIEKPLAADVTQAREIVRMAHEAATIVQVGHIERYNPAFLELQSVLEDHEIIALNARRLSPFDTSNTDTDVVFDLMIHDLDLVLAIFGGEVTTVQASARAARTSLPDYVVATMTSPTGAVATLTASRVTEHKVRLLEITTLGAYIEVDLLAKTILIYRRMSPEFLTNHQRPLRYRQENVVERIYIPTAEPLMLQLQDFVRCVSQGDRPKVGAEEGLRAVELAARVREQFAPMVASTPALLAV